MKSTCAFSVVGMDLDCPNCGAKVASGNRHECERDGGVVSARTFSIEQPKVHAALKTGKKKARDFASSMPAEGIGTNGK